MITLCTLLAQAAPATQPAPSGLEAFLKSPLLMLVVVIGVFWWVMARGRSKERQRYEQMLKSLKRNDRVLTIGGIIGTVVEVRGDEVVLQVDESKNIKVHFTRSAIKGLLSEPTTAGAKQ